MGGAEVQGATLGSTESDLFSGPVRAGEYRFSVGTAGSGTLVFQTVLPALMLAAEPSRIVIEGGTHNNAAPPFDFLARTFLPLMERMGPKVQLQFERYGFYPAGGGRFCAEIQPVKALNGLAYRRAWRNRLAAGDRESLPICPGISRSGKSKPWVLNWGPEASRVEESRNSAGPGNIVMIEIGSAKSRRFSRHSDRSD